MVHACKIEVHVRKYYNSIFCAGSDVYIIIATVKSPNGGHIMGRTLVHCREVSPIS